MKKNNFIYLKIIFLLIFNILCFKNSAYCINNIGNNMKNNVKVNGKVLDNKYLSMQTIETSPEEEYTLENGEKIYKKHVSILKEYSKYDKESVLCNLNTNIVFTYDKKSFVKINDPEQDVKIGKINNKWKTRDCTEILQENNKICSVSNKFVVFKKSDNDVGEKYTTNGYVYVSCTITGDVKIHTELSNNSLDSKKYENIENKVYTHKISDNITKKEEINILKLKNNKTLDNNNFIRIKYVTKYTNSRNQIVVLVNTEANFRYNPETKTCTCLSSDSEILYNNNYYSGTVYSRPANISPKSSSSYTNINFCKLKIPIDTSKFDINCDYNGQISFKYY